MGVVDLVGIDFLSFLLELRPLFFVNDEIPENTTL